MPDFKDYFSRDSNQYRAFRPTYPQSLFEFLHSLHPTAEKVWDCGCGTGQATKGLAGIFDTVIATDPSDSQIENAVPLANVEYRVASAEQSGLADHSVDMVIVAQALHWFSFDKFFEEVERVVKENGILVALCYDLCRVEGPVDQLVQFFYYDLLGDYWPPEREHIDNRYSTIPFPFERVPAPAFSIDVVWPAEQFLGYLATWSAVGNYIRKHGTDPMVILLDRFEKEGIEPGVEVKISWSIHMLIGKVNGFL